MVIERNELPQSDKWNVEALYPTVADWEEELKRISWPEIATFKGRLGEGPETLKKFLDLSIGIERKLSKLYTYAHLRHDEDVGNDLCKKNFTQITFLYQDLQEALSWVEPEILSLSDEKLKNYLSSPVLKEYHFYLERTIRLKPHYLPAEQEELLASAGKALSASSKAFGALNNADIKFPSVKDSKGETHEVSHGSYQVYLRSSDRVLRQNAFQSMYHTFASYENTLCELISGQVQNHLFYARARKYSSCLEAAIFTNQIDPSVYHNLIATVRRNLPALHNYMKVRKKMLGLSELHMYDLHVPLVQSVEMKFSYEEAEKKVIESVAPLGSIYQKELGSGLTQGRWVDRYENARKRSGAYSSGCYDSMPYILMNFQNTFNDLMTLAHEAGHSMHSLLSNKNQPYHYSGYPIFLAEVASTFNEELVFSQMMKQDLKPEVRRFLINQKIEDIRSTFFRQTMFAEFELKIHEFAEKNVPLTPSLLKEEYRKLNVDYFGPDLVVDSEIDIEWARIPHFYYNFYVYQYATGISAAHALFEKVTQEGDSARDKYLRFLSSGSSQYPIDLLAAAGVDMRRPDAVESLIKQFSFLVAQLSGDK